MTISKRSWLQGLPKAELHLHLEGTVTPETLVTLSARHDSTPLTLQQARELYAYRDFVHFLHTFRLVLDRLQTPEDYALIVKEMMRNLHDQGVVHAEVYISWGNILHRKPHLDIEDVMAAIELARAEVFRDVGGPSIFWIADANRAWSVQEAGQVFGLAAKLKERFPAIVGIGLGGDEVGGPVEWFEQVYADAKKTGLRLTAHVGEATGPERGPSQIRAALKMGVERIGHCLAAQHDESLMRLLSKQHIPVEINITSNILTGCCPSVEAHPLPKYLEKGMLCVLNSDDPAMFGSTCLDESRGDAGVGSEFHHGEFSTGEDTGPVPIKD
ncbi:hypothetical protein NW755_013953 [Fusarium falciforme]|uniref:Adenosine deaminase domain-containing protein n=1 Tax=Fusarium falciforme TaxID=195108 RepID=A0A9W8UUR6_9HYPO|nr:hypothetical protein NW755_013953 [Fusarium falciforme]